MTPDAIDLRDLKSRLLAQRYAKNNEAIRDYVKNLPDQTTADSYSTIMTMVYSLGGFLT
ncbi:MAG TPA: hypothetical protein VJ021_00200 [Thermoplasmata archaeon]|nr:hypothetical protein [Thermoplasmata archaeon]